MASLRPKERGFSLVELLVALVFTMVLMAGMANVYKASLSTFYTSGESLSNVRRNRLSVDMLADDLNTACMYLQDLYVSPSSSPQAPSFYILPNMPINAAGPNDPTNADELYFRLDQPLAFEGTLQGSTGSTNAQSAADQNVLVNLGATIECGSATYAKQVKKGQYLLFKDHWDARYVVADPVVSGTTVQVVTGNDPGSQITGVGSYGPSTAVPHINGSGVVMMLPNQVVRYRIEILRLDPGNANGIPCLVRDQGTYSIAGFVADQPQQVISENVTGFKAYLSANSGLSWAGLPGGAPAAYTDFTDGWDGGIRAEVDTQLAASGRPTVLSTRADPEWFRNIPTLVRVDLTTRTATQRAEYSAAGNALAYRNLTQSLVFVPRHSGLLWSK